AGSIQFELFGKKAAERGLMRYLSSAIRNVRASNSRVLALSTTTANDLITRTDQLPGVSASQAIPEVVKQNAKWGILPKTTLHNFVHLFYDPGEDPVLPILSYREDGPKLTALALFKGDQLAGKVTIGKAFFISMFQHSIKGVDMEFEFPLRPFRKYSRDEPEHDKEHFNALIRVKKGKSNTKLIDKHKLHYRTELNFDVNI